MATPNPADALIRAAERITGRPLSLPEQNRLVGDFNSADGDVEVRARYALRELFGWSEEEYGFKARASDNTGRAIRDLVALIKPSKP